MTNYKSFTFTHPTARATTVSARTSDEAWTKLQRTHEYHLSDRKGWKSKPSGSTENRVDKVVESLLEGREDYVGDDGSKLDFSDDCYTVWIELPAGRRVSPGTPSAIDSIKTVAQDVGIKQEPTTKTREDGRVMASYAGLHYDHAEQLQDALAEAGINDVFMEAELDND